jgi:hypothetical protein
MASVNNPDPKRSDQNATGAPIPMKTKRSIAAFVTSSLLILAGCGKNDSATPAAPQNAPSPPVAQAAPAKPADQAAPAPLATNAVPAAAAQVAATAATAATAAAPDATPPATTPTATTPAPTTPAPTPDQTVPPTAAAAPAVSIASLPQDQLVAGLKDALGKGLQQAVASLGHDGGFLTNLNVKIPMPDKLQKVESALRAMKQDKLADDFVATMNHAAEQAVPEAGSVFVDALKQMNIDDGRAILTGPDDAATKYFQKTTSTNLYAKFYPIVQKATGKTGVTAAYKNLLDKANPAQSLGGLGGLGSTLSNSVFDKDSLDIDAYVTNKALDGLFKMVADEEKQIRQNPVARTTDALQKVFGAVKL